MLRMKIRIHLTADVFLKIIFEDSEKICALMLVAEEPYVAGFLIRVSKKIAQINSFPSQYYKYHLTFPR